MAGSESNGALILGKFEWYGLYICRSGFYTMPMPILSLVIL
jgi:hypothetical protein